MLSLGDSGRIRAPNQVSSLYLGRLRDAVLFPSLGDRNRPLRSLNARFLSSKLNQNSEEASLVLIIAWLVLGDPVRKVGLPKGREDVVSGPRIETFLFCGSKF